MVTFLDSNVLIDVQRGRPRVREAYYRAQAQAETFAISVIVLEELRLGVHRSASPAMVEALLTPFLAEALVVPFEEGDARVAARTRAELWQAGLKPSYADLLIGAHALARGGVLVTANTRDFENIPGLQLLDWTQPPADEED